MNEFDILQLKLMMEKIELYKKQKIYLSTLIDDLSGLINILQNINKEWKEKFISIWWELEEAYSYCLFENKDLSKDDQFIINNSIND